MKKRMIWTAVVVAGLTSVSQGLRASSETTSPQDAPSTAARQNTNMVTAPAGTRILIRMIDSVDSSRQKAGYRFTASLETNLQVGRTIVAPRGTTVYGQLSSASSAGRFAGSSELTLELTDMVIDGTACSRRRWTRCAHRRAGRRRKRCWDRCSRRRRWWNSDCRFQKGREALDTERKSVGVPAGRTIVSSS